MIQDIRLIAMDLDGTLLTTDKRLTARNRSAMEKAAEMGNYIVPATGRIYAGLPEEIRELPFIRYLILANGAAVYDREEDQVLYRAEIPQQTALQVFDWLDGFPAIYPLRTQPDISEDDPVAAETRPGSEGANPQAGGSRTEDSGVLPDGGDAGTCDAKDGGKVPSAGGYLFDCPEHRDQ